MAPRHPHAAAHRGRLGTWLAGGGAFLAAFLASSHHAIHMMLLSLGIGGSALLLAPTLRLAMVLVSLAMTGLGAWWLHRHPRERPAEGWAILASLYLSLAFLAWTVLLHD